MLVEQKVCEFVDVMASAAPAPGGGSASALNGALGVALVSMVCALTEGKKKYAANEALVRQVRSEAMKLKDRFIRIVDTDSEAFNAVSAVFAMPKQTEEQARARRVAMQRALKACIESPLEMLDLACRALELVRSVVGRSNTSAASDLGCAVLNLKSCAQGAWLNVFINLGGMEDATFVSECRRQGEALAKKAAALADETYAAILSSLMD